MHLCKSLMNKNACLYRCFYYQSHSWCSEIYLQALLLRAHLACIMCNKSRKDQQKNIKLSFILTDISVYKTLLLGTHSNWQTLIVITAYDVAECLKVINYSVIGAYSIAVSILYAIFFQSKQNRYRDCLQPSQENYWQIANSIRRRKTQAEVFAQAQNNGPAVCSLRPYKRLHLSTHLSTSWKLLASSETSGAWY